MKKKIFHFVSTNILSGLENMVINISTLVRGYDYTYVSPNGPINSYLNKLGIKHISINKMTPLNVRQILKRYNPNIVQGHDVKATMSLSFNYSLCKKKHMKIISELHNDDPRMHKLTIRSELYKLFSRHCNQIIVVSSSVINNYIFRKKIQNKTIVIDNVINPLIIQNSLDKNFDIINKWDCIFIGRLSYQKDPQSFVKIISDLKKYNENISAVMIGEGPLKESINNLIDQYDLSNNIKLMGFQRNPYKYLNKSKLLIMPSIYEGFGLVALESLIIGTPVIASPVGGLKNIIDNNCGYFAKDNDDFVNKTRKLLFNKHLYNYKKKYTYINGTKVNNIKKFIRKYKKIYDKS